ncbi:hypothetical protein [Paraburkholderia bannensis]|uniref:hypothetical protein n=1 Tax=Paraburkholderia bannensis TaxID=765414 RepID=UPI002AC37126|nr:hypothetical protein [Paraburkholderia bannensis]
MADNRRHHPSCIIGGKEKIGRSIYDFGDDFAKLIFHDQASLGEILQVGDLATNVTTSFLFRNNETKKIVFDHRVGTFSEKPILVISKPRSGTHIVSNILKAIGLQQVCVFLDHMDTYCYRLDESQRLIHQFPTGIPLFSAYKMFASGQFSHSHLIYSDWAAENITNEFAILTLDRNFISFKEYIISDMKGRIYNKIISGHSNTEICELIIGGVFDVEIEFLFKEYEVQTASIDLWSEYSDIHIDFNDLFVANGGACAPIINYIFGDNYAEAEINFWSELVRRVALEGESFTKRSDNKIHADVDEILSERIESICK